MFEYDILFYITALKIYFFYSFYESLKWKMENGREWMGKMKTQHVNWIKLGKSFNILFKWWKISKLKFEFEFDPVPVKFLFYSLSHIGRSIFFCLCWYNSNDAEKSSKIVPKQWSKDIFNFYHWNSIRRSKTGVSSLGFFFFSRIEDEVKKFEIHCLLS